MKLIAIPVGKGCVLYLTPAEYVAAVQRGKRIRRWQQRRRREQSAVSDQLSAFSRTRPMADGRPPTASPRR